MIDTGCVYRVKDKAWIWLCGTMTIVVMEEGGGGNRVSLYSMYVPGLISCSMIWPECDQGSSSG